MKGIGYRVKGKGVIISIAAFLLFAIIPAFAAEETSEGDYIFAKKAFSDGFYDLAQERLRRFLAVAPQSPNVNEAHILLGRSFYYKNNLSAALMELEGVLNNPAASAFHDEATYWIGEIYFRNGDFKKSLEYYQKIIDNFPSSQYTVYAIYSKAWAYYRLGFLEEAIQSFRQVVKEYPFEKMAADSQFKIGECYYLLSRYDDAGKELGILVEKYPVSDKAAEAYYMKGEASFYQSKYSDAIASYRKAVSFAPEAKWVPFAIYRIGRSYFYLKDYENSIKELKSCLDDHAAGGFLAGAALLGLAENYHAQGRNQEAAAVYDGIIAEYADEDVAPEAYYRKARLAYEAARYGEAEELCRKAIDLFPDSQYADKLHYELGWVYSADSTRQEEALEELGWVIEKSEDMNLVAGALCKTGDIYAGRPDYKQAISSYDSVLKEYPATAWADYAQYQIARIFLATDRVDEAIIAYHSLLTNFPNSTLRKTAFSELASAYFKSSNYEQASSVFEKYLSEFPSVGVTDVHFYLAVSLYNLDRFEEALKILKKVANEASDETLRRNARYQIGWCYWRLHKIQNAVSEFEKFLKDYPSSEIADDVRFWFGEHYRSEGQYEKAVKYLEGIVNNPSQPAISGEALFQLAQTLSEAGKEKEAVEKFKEAASRFPSSDLEKKSFLKIALLEKKMKNYDEAIEYFTKTLTKENTEANAQIQYEIAECLDYKGSYDKATEEYLKVAYLYPTGTFWTVRAQLKCAMVFERLERWDEAKRLYEKLAAMDVEESGFAKERLEWIKWRGGK